MLLLIEPHPDDILLGASAILKRAEPKTVDIITLFDNGSNSSGLKDYYPSIRNIHPAEWGCERKLGGSGSMLFDRAELKGKASPATYHDEVVNDIILKKRFPKFKETVKRLNGLITDEYKTVMCPLGVVHLDHVLLRQALEHLNVTPYCWLDMPYYRKKYVQVIVEDLLKLKALKIVTLQEDERKLKMVPKVYPEQKFIIRWEYKFTDRVEFYTV